MYTCTHAIFYHKSFAGNWTTVKDKHATNKWDQITFTLVGSAWAASIRDTFHSNQCKITWLVRIAYGQ